MEDEEDEDAKEEMGGRRRAIDLAGRDRGIF